jgi:hypothetical protein
MRKAKTAALLDEGAGLRPRELDPMNQKGARRKYKALIAAVKATIDAADPIGLLELGAPIDEYEPEVGSIVPRVLKAADIAEVHRIVHEEFIRWFGVDTAGPIANYDGSGNLAGDALMDSPNGLSTARAEA